MDARERRRARRRSWYGTKRPLKRVLALRLPHALVRIAARVRPGLRAGGRLPAPARLKEVEGEVAGTRFAMLRPDRCIVAKELYWGHGRRPRPEDRRAVELFAAAARRSDVVVDVGAYTGLFTLVAARVNPAAEVHGFELIPENFRALFDNCVRNDVLDRVMLHHRGVGEPGARIRVPPGSRGSALPDFHSSAQRFDSGVAVELAALDSVAEHLAPGARVTVKIDVEGAEADVLRHGQRLLSGFRPVILCEVLPGAAGRELERLLSPHGYRFHLVREHDLAPSPRIAPDGDYRDWLFEPTPAADPYQVETGSPGAPRRLSAPARAG